MKKYLFAALMLCCASITSNAQAVEDEYVPFVVEGKAWYCNYIGDDGTPSHYSEPTGGIGCTFVMQGDTLINDLVYKRVFCLEKECYGDTEYHYYCAVREEDRRVYCVAENEEADELLCDFSNPNARISLIYDGIELEREPGWNPPSSVCPTHQCLYGVVWPGTIGRYNSTAWFDGTGNIYGNPFAVRDPFESKRHLEVLECIANGEQVFHQRWVILPTLIFEPEDSTIGTDTKAIYDLQGRRLSGKPERGVYIQDGRKHIVR